MTTNADMEKTNDAILPNYKIFFYYPNIIGYIRIVFCSIAFYFFEHSDLFVGFYVLSIILDAVDGWVARKFHQCSVFGSWLDVIIDNVSRGLFWGHIHPNCYLISAIEWMAFVGNHQLGADWHSKLIANTAEHEMNLPQTPKLITNVLTNDFRNVWGAIAISGLHGLPIAIFIIQRDAFYLTSYLGYHWMPIIVLTCFSAGRAICLLAEIWSIYIHIMCMLHQS